MYVNYKYKPWFKIVLIITMLMCIGITACNDEIDPDNSLTSDMSNSDMQVTFDAFRDIDQSMVIDMSQILTDQSPPLDMEVMTWCSRCTAEDACPEGFTCQTHQGFSFCTQQCEQDNMCPDEYHCVQAQDSMIMMNEAVAGMSAGEMAGMSAGEMAGMSAGEMAGMSAGEMAGISAGISAGMAQGQIQKICIPISNRCDSKLCRDDDGDGYGLGPDCLGFDCADDDANIHSGVLLDECDGLNNDCDEFTDESFVSNSCGIGLCEGQSQCNEGVLSCEGGGSSQLDDNCNGVDEDCDGQTDEGYRSISCGFGVCQQMSICQMGEEQCIPLAVNTSEIDATCNGIDDDCDQIIDEGYRGVSCGVGACTSIGRCEQGMEVCTPTTMINDDANCNQIDDDCDGQVDESYVDSLDISCGIGACLRYESCHEGLLACIPADPSDDDNNCNGIDDNCNGIMDDTCADNTLSFELLSQASDHIIIGIMLARGEEIEVNYDTLARTLEVRFQFDARLNPLAITLGQVPHSFGFSQNPSDYDRRSDFIRFAFPSLGDQGTEYRGVFAGEFMTIRFNHAEGITGPFNFTWVRPEPCEDLNNNQVCEDISEPFTDVNQNGQHDTNTNVSPRQANDILQLIDASLGE